MYDWINVNQVKNVSKRKSGNAHPCQMPLEVMKKIVGIIPEDYVIVDPFMGSGTTILAAIACGREYIGIELDEDYYRYAVEQTSILL